MTMTGLGRDVLENMVTTAQHEVQAVRKELREATHKIDCDATMLRAYARQVTELQAAGKK